MTSAEYVIEMLGGPRVFRGRALPSAGELRERITEGLPFSSLESVRARLRLTVPELAAVLRMPTRTLARRRQLRRLEADESDRLYRVARVAGQAVTLLGSEEAASAWLRRPNRALGGEPPVRLLDTDIGARQVEDVLGRLEHGVIG